MGIQLIIDECEHDWEPTFQYGDTYRCAKCGKEINMTEDEDEEDQ